ncbi:CsbD family protein [Janibacter limosus]|uniref:CsbD family protein n=1 Tax=Janibacter limosus TaxID=53458 RepID=A0AC61U2W0_9MICO|nr:CsbD family protein [Janibacter limosus]UUZ44347.1 CsbD family protein [Janibacter limosus]
MGIADKAENSLQDMSGKAKDKVGDATDDKDLQARGKTDQAKAKTKKAGEDIKDELG